MMDSIQRKIWETLVDMSGETVARAFTDYYGNQLLNDDFLQFLQDEGYVEEEYEEDEEDENE